MKSILVLTCLCFIGVSRVYGTSRKVLDFTTYFNGDLDNKAQTEKVRDDHDFVQARLVPIDVRCLRPDPVVFGEEDVNNATTVMYLAVVKDGIEDTVSLTIYFVTDYAKYKPREFNFETLSNISCEELKEDTDCIASYRISSQGYAYGNFPNCGYTVNGKHPRFTSMHTCDSVTMTLPMYSKQTSPMEPYELLPTGKRYPLINPPADYVSPCGN